MACSWCWIDKLPEIKGQSSSYTIRRLRLDDGTYTKGVAVRDADGIVVNSAPYSASYKRLAEDWNWERHTVQSFIEELTALSVITSKRQGNVYVFSSARSLTNSSSYDFTFPIISPQNDNNATIKCVLQNLCELACCNSKTTCVNDSLSNDFQIGKPNYRFRENRIRLPLQGEFLRGASSGRVMVLET